MFWTEYPKITFTFMNKNQIVGVLLIFSLLILSNLWGFKTSLSRERDTHRVLDLGNIESGLNSYFADFGYYPLSNSSGEMVACPGLYTKVEKDEDKKVVVKTGYKKPVIINMVPCIWGKDALLDASDPGYPAYISILPSDPMKNNTSKYIYVSDGKSYNIYARLELRSTTGFSPEIEKQKIMCGKYICNFSRSNSD